MRRLIMMAAAMALAASACGGDGGGGGQAQTEEGAIEAVERANEGALRGDVGAVLNFLSAECRASVDTDEVRLAVGLIPAFFGEFFEGFEVGDIEVRAEIISFEGTTARVTATYVGPEGESIDSLGFSSDTLAIEYEDGKWVDSGCEFEDTTERDAEALDQALAELGYEGTRDGPLPRSVAAPVGGGFVVSVDALDTDAFAALEATGGFISEPAPGEQLVLASLTVGFTGPDEPQGLSNLSGQIIGGSSSVGVDSFGCGSFPTQLSSRQVKLFQGGVATGDLCFAVPSDDIAGMLLSLQGGFGDRQIIFDPTVDAETPLAVTGSSGPAPGAEFTAAREAPTPLGEPVDLGEGWTITVNGFEPDATAGILAASEFNDPPPPGSVYALVDLTLAYDGVDQSDSPFSVQVDVVGDSNVSADPNCNVSDVPDEIDRFDDLFKGAAVTGNRCFIVDEDDLDSLVMVASADFFSDIPYVLAVR